ncbi:hypothetical protein FRB94_007864 [Tulasnella sp. JGI-2019a]|nr:hypothetical protein FRB94_007864 [Tulasnella sp. JGI-2019a]
MMPFVLELIRDIMDYIYNSGSAGHQVIDAAGLVCKTWREAALTAKWQEAMLLPLLSFLVSAYVDEWTYSSPLTKEDWERFDNIARRVKTLHTPRWYSIPDSIRTAIFDSRPDRDVSLFPRLRTLNMDWSFEHDVTKIMTFLPNNLERFDVRIGGANYKQGLTVDFMALLPQRFAHLSELTLYSEYDANDHFADAIATLLPQLPKLHYVWLCRIQLTSQMAVSLVGMSILDELYLHQSPTETIPELLLESWNTDSFLMLSTLDIPTRFDETTASLLYKVSGPNSRSLSTLRFVHLIKNGISAVGMEVERVLQAIQVHSALLHLTLQSMELESASERALQPLSSLHKLKTLEVSLKATSMRIRDEDVGELLEHLPNLESLTLALQEDTEYVLTLRTLVSALNHCPLLRDIGLLVDASTPLVPVFTQPPHRSIRSLAFGDLLDSLRVSHLDSAGEVAAFISQLSNDVLKITWGDEDRHCTYTIDEDGDRVDDGDGDYAASEIWEQVRKLIPVFQEVRRRERLQCLGGAGGSRNAAKR